MSYRLTVNGAQRVADVAAGTPLLWVLRDTLDLPGTKYGCGIGLCGACTVHIDGVAIRSCQAAVEDCADKPITTIEALSPMHPVIQAWIEEQVPQCGYCQPGMVMAATALLAANPAPSDAEIDAGMTNLCRCGTYNRIRAAVRRAARG